MNERKPLTWLVSTVLTFCISFGGLGCLISGYGLSGANLSLLCVACIFGAAGLSACFICRKPLIAVISLAVLALFGSYFWDLPGSVRLLLNAVSKIYSKAYGWGVVKLGKNIAKGTTVTAALFMLAMLTAAPTARVVCCGKRIWSAAIAGSLPLAVCLVVTDKVPSPAYLFIFLSGMLILVLTQLLRRSDAGKSALLALHLLLPSALALLLLFAALPRSDYSRQGKAETMSMAIFGWQARSPVYGDGSNRSYSIDLQNAAGHTMQQREILTVSGHADGPLYLRGAAYDTYDGLSWTASEADWIMDSEKDWRVNTAPQAAGSIHIYTYDTHSVMYIPYSPGSSTAVRSMERGRVQNTNRLERYSFRRAKAPTYNRSWNILRADLSGAAQYLQLPDSTRQSALSLLGAADISALGPAPTAAQVYGTAVDIALLVRDSAGYDLDTGPMPESETDFAIWFLEDGESGICTHYASAAAVLLRAANIPARYVAGYMVFAPESQETVVTQADAHAWVEYYIPGIGWQLLESTPPFAQELQPFVPMESTSLQTPQSPESTAAPVQPTPAPVQPTPTPSPAPQSGTGRQPANSPSPTGGSLPFSPLLFILPALILIAAAILIQYRVRLSRRKQRSQLGSTNDQFLFCWSWAEPLAERLHEAPPEKLLALAKKAKYSQHAITGGELDSMREYLKNVTARQPEKPRLLMLRDRLIYALY